MSGQTEIIEDVTIRKSIDSIYDMLAELPKKKKICLFEQISSQKELDFVKEFDGIYYVVLSHFDNSKAENMVEKVNRILNNEV